MVRRTVVARVPLPADVGRKSTKVNVRLACGHEVRTNLRFVDGQFRTPAMCNCHQCDANPCHTRYTPGLSSEEVKKLAKEMTPGLTDEQAAHVAEVHQGVFGGVHSGSTQDQPDCDCGPSPQVVVCESQLGRACRWERIYNSTEQSRGGTPK